MTAIPQSAAPPQKPLSQRLLEPLRLVWAHHRFLAFAHATCQLAALAAAAWLVIVLVLGSFRDIPPFLAVPLALAAWLTLLLGIHQLFLRRPVFQKRNLASAAHLVDLALPATHERISSALELSQESDPRFQGSPELIAFLIRQAEKDADLLDPHAVVSGKSVLQWLAILFPLLILWLVFLIVQTPALLLGLQRTIQPWSAAPPAPQATLKLEPGNITIAQGDPLTIKLAVTPPPGVFLNPADLPRASLTRHFSPDSADTELASEMERTGQRTFQLVIPSVEQSFTYSASSLGTQSPGYTVTVTPRPAIAAIEITCDFPKYTRLHPRTEISRDPQSPNAGAIDALVGTRVHITVEANQPLQSANILIADNAPNPASLDLAPANAAAPPASPNRYAADFVILKSTDYRIHLVNPQKLENKDNQPHPITARIDNPPQIAITAPTQTLKVRPDDTVPIQYTATDDFGLSAIEALVQIDNLAPTILLVPLAKSPADEPLKNTTGKFTLSLPDLFRSLPPNAQPQHILYQLRATDNRDPAPQSSLSARQLLELDSAALPLAQRQDITAVKSLADAVKKAQADLQEAQQKLADVQKADPAKPLDDRAKQQAAEAQKKIAEARQDLQSAADQSADSRLQSAAQEAKDIAQNPLQHAQENTAKTQNNADLPDARNQSAAQAQKNIDQAQQQLAALAQHLSETAQNQPRQQQLERLAAEQDRVARELAQNPNDPKLQQEQAQLQKQTEQFIKENPDFQKPAADAHQAQADNLIKQIQNLEQAQQPFRDTLQNQTDAANAPEKTADLARRQQELNHQIEQFKGSQAAPLKQAAASGAKTPDKSQLDPIVKELQTGKLQTAAQAQRAAGVQLDEVANRLQPKPAADQQPPSSDQPTPSQKNLSALQDQTQKLAQQIADAAKDHNPPTRPSDPANREAARQADQLKKEAQQLANSPASSPALKQAAQQAAQDANAAKRDADAGNASAAQKRLADAENKLAQAAPSTSPPASSKGNAAAAAQAHDLAEKQKVLADQTAKTANALDAAAEARSHADQTAHDQKALAQDIAHTAKQAQALQDQTQPTAPEMSQQAAKACQSLQQAATAQQNSAQSTEKNAPAPAQAAQEQSAEQLAQAEEALTGKPSAFRRQPASAPNSSPSQSTARNPGNNQGQPQGQQQSSNPGQSQTPGQNQGQNPTASPSANGQPQGQSQSPGQGQSPGASQSASGQGQSQGQGQGQTPGASPSATGQGQGQTQGQGQAQSASSGQSGTPSSASGQGQGQSSGSSSSASGQGQSQSQAQGQGQGQAQGQAQSASAGQGGSPSPGASSSPGQGPGDLIQSAHHDQTQAAKGNPDAARRAADELSQAARQLAQSNGQSGTSPNNNPSHSTGTSSAAPGSPSPGNNPGTGGGITATPTPTPAPPIPQSVQDIGLSPSDWAHLPPNLQEQLLHAADQSGPPAYHDMIKNYYSRIAQLQQESATTP